MFRFGALGDGDSGEVVVDRFVKNNLREGRHAAMIAMRRTC